MLIDTHCHIHEPSYQLDADQVIDDAANDGVSQLIVVGTDVNSSKNAVQFCSGRSACHVAVGVHPHEASIEKNLEQLSELAQDKSVVAIGECGLDYYYMHSDKPAQEYAFRHQLDLAKSLNLPLIFHVRGSIDKPDDAMNDFLRIVADYQDIRGVVHSFSSSKQHVEQILKVSLYFGLNGIMTFSNDESQQEAWDSIPLESIILETDAPFLTPKPNRGKINEPKHLVQTAEYLATRRMREFNEIAKITTQNAKELFEI